MAGEAVGAHMWRRALSFLWRRLPKRWRRWGVLLTAARFTVTAAAVIVDEQGRVLLLQHRFRPGSGWGVPGGFLKAGEQPEAALRRELREEVGLEIENVEMSSIRTLTAYQQIEIVFRCRAQGEATPRSLEIRRAEWFAWERLPEALSMDQRRLIKRTLQEEL
jgi:ADP-ribose pyrophosphatase YjhB (NUDIX family)